MKKITLLLFIVAAVSAKAQSNLKFESVIWVSDSIKTCPAGYVWQIQSVLNTDAYLEGSKAEKWANAFSSANQSDITYYYGMDMRRTKIWISGTWFYPTTYPFYLTEGDKVSSGNKNRYVAIAQYKIVN